jgi:hypothetical protein
MAAGLLVLGCVSVAASPAGASPTAFRATLTGAAVPGGGEPRGSGFAYVVIDESVNQICVFLFSQGSSPVIFAHIHKGAAGAIGPHAVDLTDPINTAAGSYSVTCSQDEAPQTLHDIAANPGGYYVNVHTRAFPNGGVRGQLAPL